MGVRGFSTDILENWPLGVITSILADRLPDGAIPAAKNSQFYDIGPQTTVFGTRKGCAVQNTAVNSGGAVVSQYFLNTDADDYHLVINAAGDLQTLAAATFSTVAATAFASPADQFSWQTFNNLAFVVNGTDALKTDGTDIFAFGIQQPDSGDWSVAAASGGSSLPAGVYNLKISYFNSTTSHEGPSSDAKTVTILAGQTISVTLPDATAIGDAQVDYIKIYIEEDEVRNDFFLAVTGATPAITNTTGWAVSTATVVFDIPQSDLDVYTILAPDVNDNFPPPDDAKYLANHLQRLFAANDTNIFWSEVGDPESFNTTDNTLVIGQEDGEVITGLIAFGDVLVIFKRNAVYMLIGETPDSWQITLFDKTVGATTNNSIGYFEGTLFWMSLRGPQMLRDPSSGIVDITTELVGPTFDDSHIDPTDLANTVIIGHPVQHYVAWAITPQGDSTNTLIIPFDYKLQRWMASEWRIVDIRSAALVNDSSGRQWPMISDYDGWVYKLGVADADGLPSGVASAGLVTTASSTTLTDATVAWPASGLIGRYVYTWADSTGVRAAQRRKITANTTTALTTAAWDTTPTVGDHYAIGGILLDWTSAFRNGGSPFYMKRIEFLFIELASSSQGLTCDVEVYRNLDTDTPIMSRTVELGTGDLWDSAIWDVSKFGTAGAVRKRIPIRNVGYSWQTRIIHMSTGEQIYIYRNAVQWLTKTKHTGEG